MPDNLKNIHLVSFAIFTFALLAPFATRANQQLLDSLGNICLQQQRSNFRSVSRHDHQDVQDGDESGRADTGRVGDQDLLQIGQDVGFGDVFQFGFVVFVTVGESAQGQAGRFGALFVVVDKSR